VNCRSYTPPQTNAPPRGSIQKDDKIMTHAHPSERLSAIASILMAALPILAIALVGFVSGAGLA
jgi:hypothetical protein